MTESKLVSLCRGELWVVQLGQPELPNGKLIMFLLPLAYGTNLDKVPIETYDYEMPRSSRKCLTENQLLKVQRGFEVNEASERGIL